MALSPASSRSSLVAPASITGSGTTDPVLSLNHPNGTRSLVITDDVAAPGGNAIELQTSTGLIYFGAQRDGPLELSGVNAAADVLDLDAAAAQTGNILGVRDSALAVLSRFNKGGYFMTRKTAAPADADLANGEMAFWLDPSNVAPRFNVKAKRSDGTVVTASIVLA